MESNTNPFSIQEPGPYTFRAIQMRPNRWSGVSQASLELGSRKILRPVRRIKRNEKKVSAIAILPRMNGLSKDDMYVDGPMGRVRAPIRFNSLTNQAMREIAIMEDLNLELQQLALDGNMNKWYEQHQEEEVPDGRHAPIADLFRPRTRLNDDLYKDLSNEGSEDSSPMVDTDTGILDRPKQIVATSVNSTVDITDGIKEPLLDLNIIPGPSQRF